MRARLSGLKRFFATPRVSKHRFYEWFDDVYLPDDGVYVFPDEGDWLFGVLHCRIHEVWARSQGTQVRERESGFRYTPNSCLDTFAIPKKAKRTDRAITKASQELVELRNRWLNPVEWTHTVHLEFPGSTDGPWHRYVVNANAQGIGTVRYPRIVAKSEEYMAELKKRTLTNLYNERPAWLDDAHRALDMAVAEAYGWSADLTDDEILARLLELNHLQAKSSSI